MALFNKKTEKKKEPKADAANAPAALKHAPLFLQKPHITEKTLRMSEERKYAFIVPAHVSKSEAAKQIEKLYGVTCVETNVTAGAAKEKSWKGKKTAGKEFKKVIVTLDKGQKIELTGNN